MICGWSTSSFHTDRNIRVGFTQRRRAGDSRFYNIAALLAVIHDALTGEVDVQGGKPDIICRKRQRMGSKMESSHRISSHNLQREMGIIETFVTRLVFHRLKPAYLCQIFALHQFLNLKSRISSKKQS